MRLTCFSTGRGFTSDTPKPRRRIVTRISTRTRCGARSIRSARRSRRRWKGTKAVLCSDLKANRSGRRSADRDTRALRLDHVEQLRRMSWRQTHAAMRDGAAKRANGVGAMNRIAASKEDRIGHRRHFVFARIVHPLQSRRCEASARSVIPRPRRGHWPDIAAAQRLHMHSLAAEIDMYPYSSLRPVLQTEKGEQKNE